MILHPDTRVWVKYHAKFGFMILPSITMEVAFQLYSFHCKRTLMHITTYHILVPLSGRKHGDIKTICPVISFFRPVISRFVPRYRFLSRSKQRWRPTEGSIQRQDACSGVYSACRKENGQKVNICVQLHRQGLGQKHNIPIGLGQKHIGLGQKHNILQVCLHQPT